VQLLYTVVDLNWELENGFTKSGSLVLPKKHVEARDDGRSFVRMHRSSLTSEEIKIKMERRSCNKKVGRRA
jgi:hypothetical protein